MNQMTREFAEAVVNNTQHCLIHDIPMEEYGVPDLCGTKPTRCPKCESDRKGFKSVYRESEFGNVVSTGFDGDVIVGYRNEPVFMSQAFNPLTASDLRQIADHLDEVRKYQ